MIVYRAHIYNVEKGMYLANQKDGNFTFTPEYNERLCFFDEADAESTLELMNDTLPECYILVDEKPIMIYLVVMEWEYEAERGVKIEVFDHLKSAEIYFDKLVEEEQKTSWIKDCSNLIEETEDPHCYSAYDRDGEAQTHTYISIEEKEVHTGLSNIVRVDFVDTDPQPDIGKVLATYYLVNPDLKKLDEIKKWVEARFDTDDDEPTIGGIDVVEEELKKQFQLLTLDTVEIDW